MECLSETFEETGNTSANRSAGKTLAEFVLFPRLPVEIQVYIFKLAIAQGKNGKRLLAVDIYPVNH